MGAEKLGVVIPVCLRVPELEAQTYRCVERVRCSIPAAVYVVCTRLHTSSLEDFQAELSRRCPVHITATNIPGSDLSVAGAWNLGVRQAIDDGCDPLCILANDVELEPDCLDTLLRFGSNPAHADVACWSGIHTGNPGAADVGAVNLGCDFSCVMFRRLTIGQHGWFDEGFKPAYAEDNDYYARIILGGEKCKVVHAARFFHHGSLTINRDPEQAHHVRHWWASNMERFRRKWGVPAPLNSDSEILEKYHKHPFGDETKPLSWCG
jgi:GT2 family glycosyltransferase